MDTVVGGNDVDDGTINNGVVTDIDFSVDGIDVGVDCDRDGKDALRVTEAGVLVAA